jgi:hypothetical protein
MQEGVNNLLRPNIKDEEKDGGVAAGRSAHAQDGLNDW